MLYPPFLYISGAFFLTINDPFAIHYSFGSLSLNPFERIRQQGYRRFSALPYRTVLYLYKSHRQSIISWPTDIYNIHVQNQC